MPSAVPYCTSGMTVTPGSIGSEGCSSVAVVVMIELIFLLSVFAEIYTTTGGGPGDASTNVAYLIFKQALLNFDAGVASAGALFAVVLANIVGIFMIRLVGKNLDK